MKKNLTILLVVCLCGACTSVKVASPALQPPAQLSKVKQARSQLQAKKQTAKEIPPVLGGLVQSDSWIIYKDKQQEEFSGNVSYDNGTYNFKADYVLSERAKSRLTARGNVYLKQTEQDGSFYEVFADKAQYNYKAQQGEVWSSKKAPVKLIYGDAKKQISTALADHVTFNLDTNTFELSGNVRSERPSDNGMQHIRADNVLIRQADNFIRLEGNASLSDDKNALQADTLVYDGQNNQAYAEGGRVLAHGSAPQGTFAIIADKAESDIEGNTIVLNGRVQGWVVSPELKKAEKTAPHI